MTILEIAKSVISGETTARSHVEAALKRAEEFSEYHAMLSLTSERALARADEIDSQVKNGDTVGILAGVPYVAKDNYLVYGAKTTAASQILSNFEAPYQATTIDKLEAAGAICIGKTNLDSFAHGGSTENSAFGPTLNAIDKTRVAGGSSGGSAVAVALGIVPFALGTDTGGSIRQPASFNGVYGLKPTYGMCSRYGVVAMASSTDCMGCFAQSSEDVEAVINVMSGRDPRDMTTLADYFVPVAQLRKKLTIGIIEETLNDDVNAEVVATTERFADKLRLAGHKVEKVSLPLTKMALAMYYIIVPAEITSNLARYDSVRYGRRAANVHDLSDLYGLSRDEGFEPETKRRIIIGSYVLSSGYFDAYYLQAQKARTLLIGQFDEAFSKFDVLLTPTAPTPAFKLGENTKDPVKMYLADVMTVPASLVGLPALSVPAGLNKQGLPIGVQLIGPKQSDAELLALAKSLEAINV
ncbi:MAG: Asp-tRNA(Asn)/Glu-tRNA(Gln) amidotransferase subunit GatA [Candidatus Saccharimonas sp.]